MINTTIPRNLRDDEVKPLIEQLFEIHPENNFIFFIWVRIRFHPHERHYFVPPKSRRKTWTPFIISTLAEGHRFLEARPPTHPPPLLPVGRGRNGMNGSRLAGDGWSSDRSLINPGAAAAGGSGKSSLLMADVGSPEINGITGCRLPH